ncbi:MAG: peptidylprolyl isomerase [Bacteroidota bacterium]
MHLRPSLHHNHLVTLLVCVLLSACQQPQQPRTPVARIDNLTLTLEEVESRFDSSQGVSQAQVHEYIQRWLTQELLYQEAVRRGLDRTRDLETRLTDIRRQLAINALLEQEVYTVKSQESVEEQLREYFNQNKQEFVLSQDVALISFILFQDRDAAIAFRTRVVRGMSWIAAKAELLADLQLFHGVLASVDSAYHSERTLFPPELWRAVVTSVRQEPSFPLRAPEGHYVIFVWKLTRKGDIADLPYVKKEIQSRLAIAERQQVMERLLENLRSNHVVQILISSVPQDSVTLRSRE